MQTLLLKLKGSRGIFGLILLFIVGICCCPILYMVITKSEKLKVFNNTCDGGAVAEAAKYSESPGLHPILYLTKGSGGWSTAFSQFTAPAEWLPEDPQKIELVACFTEEIVTVETCEYDNGAKKVIRTRIDSLLMLREAQTGKEVAKHTFTGKPGQECSDSQLFKKGQTQQTISGDYAPQSEVDNWLKQYVNP